MPNQPPDLTNHRRVWLTSTAHKIAKAAAAAHDLPIPTWLEAAISNQAELEGVDIESVLAIQEELQ